MPLPSQSVSVRPPPDQPFFAFAIAGLSCTLSLWLTLRFCRHLWPEESGILLVMLGLTWESAKLYFGPIGVRGLCIGGPGQRCGSLMLATMALVLMAGSVVASMANLSQADAQDQQRVLTSSRAYAESQEMLRSLDSQIGVLSVAAARDVGQNFRKRALATSQAITDLRRQRRDASAALAKMEAHPEALATAPFFATLGALLPGDADANGKRIRCGAHAVIAVMLELIGVAALCVARMHRGAKATDVVASVRAAVRCIHANASEHPGKADATVYPTDAEDASGPTSLHPDAAMHPDAKCVFDCASAHLGTLNAAANLADSSGIVSIQVPEPRAESVRPNKADATKFQSNASGHASADLDRADAMAPPTDARVSSHRMHLDRTDAAMHLADASRPRLAAKCRRSTRVSGMPEKLKDARERVIRSQVAPTYRALQQALQMGQAAAQRLLRNMHADGLLKRTGRGYELVA